MVPTYSPELPKILQTLPEIIPQPPRDLPRDSLHIINLLQFFKSASRIRDEAQIREYCKSQKSKRGRDPMILGVQVEGVKSQSLHQIAKDHKTIPDRQLAAKMISEMCEVDDVLGEIRDKKIA